MREGGLKASREARVAVWLCCLAEKARASVRRAVPAARKCLMSCRMRRRWKSEMRIRPCTSKPTVAASPLSQLCTGLVNRAKEALCMSKEHVSTFTA